MKYLYNHYKHCNCLGQSNLISFTGGELSGFQHFWRIMMANLEGTNHNPMVQDLAINNIEPYKHFNRLQRAISFLYDARITDLLPKKISFYVALLESLFTSSGSNIQKIVSKRASLFIGGAETEKDNNRILVSDAYNIRSDYMHGKRINYNIDFINKISTQIDNLIRLILRKIMFEGYIIFSNFDFSKSEKIIFEKYFNDLESGEEIEEGIYKTLPVYQVQIAEWV